MSSNESLMHVNESYATSVDGYTCRLCLQCTETSMEEITFLAEKIEFVTKLTMYAEDGLPAHICTQCKFKLAIADGFIKRSIASDVFLRSRHSEEWAEPYQTDDEPILQEAEPLEMNTEEKPDTDPLQLNCEQSQLDADCDAAPQFQFPADPLQMLAAAISHAENPLNAIYNSQPIDNNIEAFAEQSDTAKPLPFACKFFPAIKTEFLSETDAIVSSDNDNYEGFTNYYQYVGSPNGMDNEFDAHVSNGNVKVSGLQPISTKRAKGRNFSKSKRGRKIHAFQCHRCDNSYKVQTFLNLHLRTHSPIGKVRTEKMKRGRKKRI